MATALADRLAEAFAERLHERVRRELWGYAPDEALANDALIAERYQGIRPAPGYPACPDHTEKRDHVRPARRRGAGRHHAHRVDGDAARRRRCRGLYLWHPQARYFGLGRIGRDQLEDYARRKGVDEDEAERWLAPNLADDARAEARGTGAGRRSRA